MNAFFSRDLPIVAFDMDGTLLTEQDGIHPRDVELLTMPDPPAIFVPTTGRSLFALRRILKTFAICDDRPLSFPMVLQNGSLVYNPDEEKIRDISFDLEIQNELITLFKTKPEISFLLFSDDHLRLINPTPFGLKETRRYMSEPENFDASAPPLACSKILCLGEDPEKVVELRELVSAYHLEVALSKPTILEFNPTGVNKGTGLEFLAEYNGWEKSRIYCAGDGDNDREMFRRFENSFTPATSQDHIQGQVRYVIDTQKEGLLTSILKTI